MSPLPGPPGPKIRAHPGSKKWKTAFIEKIDAAAFSEKIRALPHAARCAILDIVFRFWRREDHTGDMAKMLTEAGAKIAG